MTEHATAKNQIQAPAEAILLTGATGFLGTELAQRLVRSPGTRIYALVRAADEAAGMLRLKEAWQHDEALCKCLGTQVFPVPGDFTLPGLGLAAGQNQEILRIAGALRARGIRSGDRVALAKKIAGLV